MTTLQNSNYFQHQMRLETDKVLNGSRTPFKDTLTHAFETSSNILAITANATAVGRIQSRSWLLEACHESVMEAMQHDESIKTSALMAKLQAQELENAYLKQQMQATPNV
jgi:hypothetical protein